MTHKMLNLCIEELERVVGGDCQLGLMPPLAGKLEPIRRIVVDSAAARPGDVFWAMNVGGYEGARFAEIAYTRGALGVVSSTRRIAPWAGKFSLHVADANAALAKLIDHQTKHSTRRCKAIPFHDGDTTGMIASLISGGRGSLEEVAALLARRNVLVLYQGVTNGTLEVPPAVS